MADENIAADVAADATEQDEKRERSKIAFPYNDLKDATSVAQAIWDNVGAGTCDMAQLAAWLKHDSVTSGAFRLKVAAAKTFGLINSKQGILSLTRLGQEIIDPQKAARARVDAFLTVPLYRAIFTKYNGILLPNPVGLEREIAEMGVASKQTDKARQTFQRSAEQAGFFLQGANKLVRPGLAPVAMDHPVSEEEGGSGGGGDGDDGGGRDHPLVKLLVNSLPTPGSTWSKAERDKWIKLAEAAFDVVYKDDAKAASNEA